MERLTEYHSGVPMIKGKRFSEAARKLAGYEDLEEQGLLLKLPCKVGDVVHVIDDKKLYTLKATKDVYLSSDGSLNITCENCAFIGSYCYKDLGEILFLTKAEAEKALAEMKGEQYGRS